MNILLSCGIKKGIYTIVLLADGTLKRKVTGKLLDAGNTYENLLDVYTYAFEIASAEIKLEDDVNMVIEMGSKTLRKWLEQGCSRKEYFEKFMRLTDALNTIPAGYSFIQNNSTVADAYGYTLTEDKVLNIEEIMAGTDEDADGTDTETDFEGGIIMNDYDYDNVTSCLDMFNMEEE